MDFGKSLGKAGFGKKFGGGGDSNFGGGGFHDRGKAYGEQDENKKFTPGQGEETPEEEKKEEEKKTEGEEGGDTETINQIVELYDQLTPLIDKLRKS